MGQNKWILFPFLFGLMFSIVACDTSEKNGSKSLDSNALGGTGGTTEPIHTPDTSGAGDSSGNTLSGNSGVHPLFTEGLGKTVNQARLVGVAPDPTGYDITSDADGDGIADAQETISNAYVADYPQVVTRVALPISIEIRVDETNSNNNFTEVIEGNDVNQTINNSMESRHYTQLNLKTTPYVVKESYSEYGKHEEAHSYSESSSSSSSSSFQNDTSVNAAVPTAAGPVPVGVDYSEKGSKSSSRSNSMSRNDSFSDEFARSSSSERTVFEDISYTDNLDRNGVEYTDETIQRIAQNFRNSSVSETNTAIGPQAGIVRAGLYLRNTSLNIPVKVSNVLVTLSFLTPKGVVLPIKTFTLKNEDGSNYSQDIMGGAEFGPYTIEVDQLNTVEVKNALAGGYIPQISIVSYDIKAVEDSNYTPGVNNYKIVEEVTKGRTAQVVVRAEGLSESYRVTAFDKDGLGNFSPGISLKKALFRIFRNPLTNENWPTTLTVDDANLRWKTGADEHVFNEGVEGNNWDQFETYIKSTVNEFNETKRLETVKRIKGHQKYNPFNFLDNSNYDPNERLSRAEFRQMKYWFILHNGEYFEGDINDPIWVGDRYEIVFVDIGDFHDHFNNAIYYPLYSEEPFQLNTRWNRLTAASDDYRSIFLGKVLQNNQIHLEVDLLESRQLFDQSVSHTEFGYSHYFKEEGASAWYDLDYTFDVDDPAPQGIPQSFEFGVTGGTNSFHVQLTKSQNATEYEFFYCLDANSDLICDNAGTTIVMPLNTVAEARGSLVITRKTLLTEGGNELGEVAAGEYLLQMTAKGDIGGNEVSAQSHSGAQAFTITAPDVAVAPSQFSYSMNSGMNRIELKIQEALNAEYYWIKLYGPYNYGFQTGDAPQVYLGHAGFNEITIANPDAVIGADGLYKVQVVAANRNDLNGATAGTIGTQDIQVEYDRFAAQKTFAPKRVTEKMQIGAVDLEVNFDDSDEWYRLLLSSEDATVGKSIQLDGSSYTEYENQKFHAFFTVPDSIFTGGRQSVDVRIRTVAENKYRDTFWMKPSLDSEGNVSPVADINAAEKAIYFPGLWYEISGRSPVKHWTDIALHDASRIEEALACSGQGNTTLDSLGNAWFDVDRCEGSTLRYVHKNDAVDMNNYFFSPLEERTYGITARFSQTVVNSGNGNVPEKPTVQIHMPRKGYVLLDNFASSRATNFTVYWREGKAETLAGNESLDLSNGWASSTTPIGVHDYYSIGVTGDEEGTLEVGKTYSFLVIADNANGNSLRSDPLEVMVVDKGEPTHLVPSTKLILVTVIQ